MRKVLSVAVHERSLSKLLFLFYFEDFFLYIFSFILLKGAGGGFNEKSFGSSSA